jgi:hypothetical protein
MSLIPIPIGIRRGPAPSGVDRYSGGISVTAWALTLALIG